MSELFGADLGADSARYYIVGMIALELFFWLFVLFGVIRLIGGPADRPSEFDRDIFCADDEERAKRLKVATAAWKAARKAGKPYVNPYELERLEADHRASRSSSWTPTPAGTTKQEEQPRRLVRCCPMHKPHWE